MTGAGKKLALALFLIIVVGGLHLYSDGEEPHASSLRPAGFLFSGEQPKSITLSPDGTILCVPLLADSGIDLYTSAPLAYFRRIAPPAPYAAQAGFVESLWLEGLGELWISQMTTSRVHIFDSRNFAYKESLHVEGNWPKVLTALPDESLVFVSNWLSKDISFINPVNRQVAARVSVGGVPRGMATNREGTLLFAALYDTGDIAVVDIPRRRMTRTVRGTGGAMRHLVRAPEQDLFYASDMFHGTIYRFESDSTDVTEGLYLGPKINTIALSPEGRLLYASSRGPNNRLDYTKKGPEFGKLFIVDTEEWRIDEWIWGGNQPTGLAVGRKGRYIFFSDFLDRRIEVYRRN